MIVRRDAPRMATSIGAAATIIGSLCPWVASGDVERSSYEIIDLVDRLGFAEEGPFTVALRAWPLMPLLVVTGTIGVWWRHRVVGSALAVAGGAYALVVAVSVRLAPVAGPVRIGFGPGITIAGASILLIGTFANLVTTSRGSRDQRSVEVGT